MAKLWQKDYTLDELVEQFTVGNDPTLDKKLIVYDCIGSIAHAHMLMSMGLLTAHEFEQLKKGLSDIITQAECNNFSIQQSDEDVHTAVENYLTTQYGDLGKKIHTARSRNDQVALDLRLYMRDAVLKIASEVITLCTALVKAAQATKDIPIPGRTHFQRAMPSSLGLFFGAYAESLLDSLVLLQGAYSLVNQSPLGSAAGYGVVLPIDRQEVSDLLGFAKVQNNVLYVSNSRGKLESVVLQALTQIILDLGKLSEDLIIFSAPEFGYIQIPQELCSGSSIMPQKKNPDGLELVRAKSATVISNLMQVLMIIRTLPSGYNRDLQETKLPLMDSIDIVLNALRISTQTIAQIKIDADACIQSFSSELFATDHALRLVQSGVPFREAYKQVGLTPESVPSEDPVMNIQQKTHLGAPGNLNLELSRQLCAQYLEWIQHEQGIYENAINHLLKG